MPGWIINNELARRNLTPQQSSYLRGQEKLLTEKEQGRDRLDHFEPPVSSKGKLSKKHGVSPATIKRDAQFAQAVDKLSPEEKGEGLAVKSKKTKGEEIGEEEICHGGRSQESTGPNLHR